MLKRMPPFAILSLSLALLLSGCGDKTEKTIGHWKSQDSAGGWHTLLEIAKNSMKMDETFSDTAMETKDDKVVVRKAGTDTVIAIITVVDDNTLDVEVEGKKTRYLKSSPEEHAKLIAASPKERVVGFWKTSSHISGQTTVLEIGQDYLSDDGRERVPLERKMKAGALFLDLGPNKDAPLVTFLDDDHMEMASPWMGRNKYERLTPEAAAKILSPSPELVMGYWVSGEDVLHITSDSFAFNGAASPVALSTGHKAVVGVDPSDSEKIVARIQVTESGTIALDAGPMAAKKEFTRAAPEDVQAKLDAYAKAVESVVGVWMSEKVDQYKRGGRDFMVITMDSYTRNDRTAPSSIRPVAGGVEILNQEKYKGSLASIKLLGENRIETDSGGFMSEKVVFVKTSPENMQLLQNPQPANALGHWVSETGNAWLPNENALVVTESAINRNGRESGAFFDASEGEVLVKDVATKQVIARITFRDVDHFQFKDGYSRDPKEYRRATKEEVEAVHNAYRAGLEGLYGFWLSEKEYPGRKGGHQILEITPDRAVFNNDKYTEYKPAYANGKIYFTPEGDPEKYYGMVDILDDVSINTGFRALDNGVFKRSTPQTVDTLLNPKPEQAYGFWLTEKTNAMGLPIGILVLTPQEAMLNYDRRPVHYASGDGRLIVESPDRRDTILRIRQIRPKRLVMSDNNDTVYNRVTQEELQKALTDYQRLFQENALGFWKAKQVGGKPSIVYIGPDRIDHNKRSSPNYKLGMRNGIFRLTPEGRGSIDVEVLDRDRIKYEHSEFVRTNQEEYEQLLQLWK